jgi:hypothetical protein
MGTITGSSSAEIAAPVEQVWEVVEDVLSAPEWQGGLKAMKEIERDPDGRVALAESGSDAKVRTIKSIVRFSYDAPTRLSWQQEQGELKSVEGSWELEDLGGERTQATYRLEVELGRKLGLIIRGPLVDVLRGQLVSARAKELQERVEGASSPCARAWRASWIAAPLSSAGPPDYGRRRTARRILRRRRLGDLDRRPECDPYPARLGGSVPATDDACRRRRRERSVRRIEREPARAGVRGAQSVRLAHARTLREHDQQALRSRIARAVSRASSSVSRA